MDVKHTYDPENEVVEIRLCPEETEEFFVTTVLTKEGLLDLIDDLQHINDKWPVQDVTTPVICVLGRCPDRR